MAAVVLYAEFTAKPGQEERVDDLIGGLTDQVRAEPGNLEFVVYRERDEPRRFFVFERYADQEAFQTHIGAEYGAVFNAALGDLIEEDGSQLTFLLPSARTHTLSRRHAADRPRSPTRSVLRVQPGIAEVVERRSRDQRDAYRRIPRRNSAGASAHVTNRSHPPMMTRSSGWRWVPDDAP